MQILKQSTASQAIKLGPFVDDTDGKTAETGLTIANTDIQVSKAGGTFGNKNSGGGTHDADGWYTATLDATDTATVGTLDVQVVVSGALPVFARFQVVEEAIYDGIFAASAGALATGSALTTVDTVVDGIQTDLDNATDGLGAIKTAVDARASQTSVDTIDANVDAILVDTGTTIPGTLTTIDTVVDGIQTDLDNGTDGLGALKALIDALNDISTADVNAQVLDVCHTDTRAEPGQGAPGATISAFAKIDYLYKAWRNKSTQTATTLSLYDDAGTTVDQASTVSDDGTTATRGEIGTGA